MLTIDRKEGQAIIVGGERVELISSGNRHIVVSFRGAEWTIKRGQNVFIGDTDIFFIKMNYSKARIGFDGPSDVKIVREELLDNGIKPEKNTLEYIKRKKQKLLSELKELEEMDK